MSSSLIHYMISKDWLTRQEMLDVFEQSFKQGYIGFHLCPHEVSKDTDEILEHMCDLFDLPYDANFFHVVSCKCNKIAVYIDPSIIRKYTPCETVRYCYDPK